MWSYVSCILGILSLLPDFNQGFTCLSCKAAVIPKDCDTIEHCGPHEECYVDLYATTIGSLRFNLGCRDSQHCLSGTSTGKRRATNTILSSRCCQGNLCNNATTNYAGYAQTRGPICFNCATQGHYDTCDKIKVCGEHEICDAAILVGKRTEDHLRRDATCWECCDTDLCNDKCIHQGAHIDPCSTHTQPCLHGTCYNKGSSYVCQCDQGWTGNHCETEKLADLCLSNPCAFGTCTNYGSYYACACTPGYTGVNCDRAVTVDNCSTNPCVHGVCTNSASGYNCTCNSGYSGQTCDIPVVVDSCSANPCVNGACTNSASGSGYNCTCNSGYSGQTCKTRTLTMTESSGTNSVVEGGTLELICMIPNSAQTYWNIPSTTTGVCNCLNDGTCLPDKDTRITCGTVSGGVSLKLTNVSFNDMGEYICRYLGTLTDKGTLNILVKAVSVDNCSKTPCVHGTCANSTSGYNCSCNSGYSGQTCDTHCGKDIVFMVDRSIGARIFPEPHKLITFLYKLVKDLEIGPTDNLVGLIEYDTNIHVQWDLGTYSNKTDVIKAITKHRFYHTFTADNDKAVQYIVDHALTPAGGDRADHKDAVVLFATSDTTHRISVNIKNAKKLQQLSHDVIVFSVGPPNALSQVDNLATDNSHVFHVSTYAEIDDTMTASVLSILKSCT